MDLAELQIKADSRQLSRSNEELDRMVGASERAERSARGFGRTQRESARDQIASINQLNERLDDLRRQRDKANSVEAVKSYNREIQDLTNQKRSLEHQGQKVEKNTSSLNNLFKVGAGLIASYFSVQTVRRIIDTVTQTARLADEIDKMNERTGLGVEFLQEYRFVTEQLGVEFSGLESSVESFTRRIPRIESGSGRSADAMASLGISLRDSSGEMRAMDQLLPEILEKLRGMENETERNAVAQELLGRRSAELIPLLNAEQEEVDGLLERFRDMGVAMDEGAIKKAVAYKDRMAEMSSQIEGLRNEFGLLVMDLVEDYNVLPWLQRTIANAADLQSRFSKWRDPLSDIREEIEQNEIANSGYAESFRQVTREIEEKLRSGDLTIEQEKELREQLALNRSSHEERMGQLLAEQARMTQVHLKTQERIEGLKESGEWEKMSNYERERANDVLEAQAMMIESVQRRLAQLTNNTREASSATEEVTQAILRFQGAAEPDVTIINPYEEQRISRLNDKLKEYFGILEQFSSQNEDEDFSHRLPTMDSIAGIEDAIAATNRQLREATTESERAFLRERLVRYRNELQGMKGDTEEVSDAARDLGFTFQSAAEDAIVSWSSFGDVLDGVLQDILRIITRITITEPLGNAVEGAADGLFGSSTTAQASQQAMQANMAMASSTAGMSSGGVSGGVNVNVYNQNGSEVEVQERENANGGMDMDIIIKRAVQGLHNSGSMDSTMNRNYGVRRRARSRG